MRSILYRWRSMTCLLPLVAVSSLLWAHQSSAQPSNNTKPAAQPVVPSIPSEPGLTTATFGDWLLRCQRSNEADKSRKICEVTQSVQVQGQSAPIAQVAIGRVATGDPLTFTAVLPNSVAFPSTVRVLLDEKDSQGLDLPWRRCLPGRCVADAPAREDVLKRWRAAAEAGRIMFKDGSGRDVALPVSFRGLAQALDALARE
ncbi:invasion associated locus B family protein [Methylorubrum aminovorans]